LQANWGTHNSPMMSCESHLARATNLSVHTGDMKHLWTRLLTITVAVPNFISPIRAAEPSKGMDSFPVRIVVDASRPMDELKPIWRFFGADEPNYAYMKQGQKLIGE